MKFFFLFYCFEFRSKYHFSFCTNHVAIFRRRFFHFQNHRTLILHCATWFRMRIVKQTVIKRMLYGRSKRDPIKKSKAKLSIAPITAIAHKHSELLPNAFTFFLFFFGVCVLFILMFSFCLYLAPASLAIQYFGCVCVCGAHLPAWLFQFILHKQYRFFIQQNAGNIDFYGLRFWPMIVCAVCTVHCLKRMWSTRWTWNTATTLHLNLCFNSKKNIHFTANIW